MGIGISVINVKGAESFETIEFYNGQAMPKVGLGTFRIENNNECQRAVQYAIEQGIEV